LCFYLYALESDEEALKLIMQTVENDASGSPKIATFVSTLNFRVGNYLKAGVIGKIILSFEQEKKLPEEILNLVDLQISTK